VTGGGVPSSVSVLLTLMTVTWRRLVRGRALWVSVLIAALPVVLAAALQGHGTMEPVRAVQFLTMALLPPLFVASSLGEEIEDRTTTYLWSRPIGRWTIVIGKLLALAPVATMLVVGGFAASHQIGTGASPAARAILAMCAGSLAIAAMSAGIATLVPRHGMALSIVYLVIFDLALGAIPASINQTSITHQVALLVDPDAAALQPALTMTVIAGGWLAIALWRIRRLES
jgi:ABC-type transport system involved in multi-copper enzyme maturation permease subunit